jgi:WD40 repeat protein
MEEENKINTPDQNPAADERRADTDSCGARPFDPKQDMPLFQCHKKVRALQIITVQPDELALAENRETDGGVYLTLKTPDGTVRFYNVDAGDTTEIYLLDSANNRVPYLTNSGDQKYKYWRLDRWCPDIVLIKYSDSVIYTTKFPYKIKGVKEP